MSATLLRSATYDIAPAKTSSTLARPSRRALITGRILTGIVALLLTLDAGIKLVRAKPAIEGSAQLGFSPDQCAATPRDPAPLAAWEEWWAGNRSRYSAPDKSGI